MSMSQTQNTLRYAGLATQWMVMLLIAVWVGHKVDQWLNWKAGFVIVFPLISLVVSLWIIIRDTAKTKK